MRTVDITINPGQRCYTVYFDDDGEVYRVVSTFYGFKGRLYLRRLKKDGKPWALAEAAARRQLAASR